MVSILNNKTTQVSVITGGDKFLYLNLKASIKRADRIDIIVSFLMESGVKLILEDIKNAVAGGAKVRILTGNYLNITQPQALYLLKGSFEDKIELRFYNEKVSFHPKAYIFHYGSYGELFIGSSNISRGALTNSIEWNYRLNKDNNKEDFTAFQEEFEELFHNHSIIVTDKVLKDYAKTYVKPKFQVEAKSSPIEVEGDYNLINFYEPRGAQIEALYSLEKSREEGFEKGIVVAATGIGKTYLAAFDSKKYEKVLFIAHRQEIIEQAEKTFKNIRPMDSTGFFYKGIRDTGKKMIFALIQSLGREEYLNESYFGRDYFDYIVVDEFHHVAAKSYQRILDYFKPKFLLGITATPERLDNKNVFKVCDYNLVYEIRLFEAISRGELVPFRYYGIYDSTVNYDNITYLKGKYNADEIEKALMINKRGNLVLKHYNKFKSKCVLGFCESKNHAEYMAKYFNDNGIPSVSVYSGETMECTMDRKEAIRKLENGEIKVIFSVDMFNEGVDIPKVDLIMMLRPTQSSTVFLQQLGRGLRKYKDKEYLNVIDFIGNYKKANLVPSFLQGRGGGGSGKLPRDIVYPKDCYVDFDVDLIDIFNDQNQREINIKTRVKEEYLRIKEELGYPPLREDMLLCIEEGLYSRIRTTRNNLMKDYLKFLDDNGFITNNEKNILEGRGYDFIHMIETTAMSKTYKIPILLAFYNNGKFKMKITDDDIYEAFRDFYNIKSNEIDMMQHNSTKRFKDWGIEEYLKLAKENPIKALAKTHGDFFSPEDNGFAIRDDIKGYIEDETFLEHVGDAIQYRKVQYYKDRFDKERDGEGYEEIQ